MKKAIGFFIGILLCHIALANSTTITPIKYAIMVPMHDESVQILKNITHKKHIIVDGIHYIEGNIQGQAVVFVNSGLGKTNMSVVSARLIHDYHPQYIFLAGSAGGMNPHIKKYTVVIGENVIDADLGTLTKNGPYYPNAAYFSSPQKNNAILPKSYSASKALVQAARSFTKVNSVQPGAIATSDALPNKAPQVALLKQNKIDAVEMEGASLMQTCWLFNTQCIVIRGISNDVNEEITQKDTIIAGNNATQLVEKMIGLLSNGAK